MDAPTPMKSKQPAQQHNGTAVCCSSIGCPTSCPNYDSHEMAYMF